MALREKSLFLTYLLVILATLPSCCLVKSPDSNIPATTRATISTLRTEAEFRVKQIKKNYPENSTEYQKAALLYTAAEAKYNGWIDEMKSVLGECRNFNERAQYTELLNDAAKSSQEFINYCDSLSRKGLITPVSPLDLGKALADISISFWETGRKARQERIAEMKKDLDGYKWPDFDKIQ